MVNNNNNKSNKINNIITIINIRTTFHLTYVITIHLFARYLLDYMSIKDSINYNFIIIKRRTNQVMIYYY
jgi:hypothetical protein